jgi:UDP-glucuronate 4-epimerase
MNDKNRTKDRKNYDVLITGAAGFIGSHVSEHLLKNGISVLGIDDLNDYYPVALKKNNLDVLFRYENFNFLCEDICNLKSLEDHLSGVRIDRIAHIAARAGVRPSIKDPLLYQKVNVEGTLNILELARAMSVSNLVLTSSSSVYGNSKNIPFKEDDTTTDKPVSPYAATKKASEVLAHTYHHLYKVPISIIRPFTVYGPRGRPDMAPWLFMSAAINGTPINKFGDGSTRRDYTYIDDFVSGFINALLNPRPFEIFNLGNSTTVSLNEAILTIEEISGKEIIINQMGEQPGDVPLTNADISKARSLLSYHPETSFSNGMKLFHDWYSSNIRS